MPTPDQMIAAVHGYVGAFDKADPELAVALFAADAAVEDPVGTPPKVGTDAIREFYTMSMQTGAKLHLDGPIRVGADYAAFAFQVRLTIGTERRALSM
jgi:steroid delta-isomerase